MVLEDKTVMRREIAETQSILNNINNINEIDQLSSFISAMSAPKLQEKLHKYLFVSRILSADLGTRAKSASV